MNKPVTLCLIVVGLINFTPLLGIISSHNIEAAYSVKLADNSLAILMQHRALLFGILGGFILYSCFKTVFQPAAMVMGFVSMAGFVLLALGIGEFNEAIKKVMIIDIIGIIVLMAAMALKFKDKTT